MTFSLTRDISTSEVFVFQTTQILYQKYFSCTNGRNFISIIELLKVETLGSQILHFVPREAEDLNESWPALAFFGL